MLRRKYVGVSLGLVLAAVIGLLGAMQAGVGRRVGSGARAADSAVPKGQEVSLGGIADIEGCATMPSVATEEYQQDKDGRVIGVIETGFLFVDGKYVNAPYEIVRVNRQVAINGTIVWEATEVEPPEPPPANDPEVPATISRDTSIYSDEFKKFIRTKVAYVQSRHDTETERRIMLATYQRLPCIEHVQVDPSRPTTIDVRSVRGEKAKIALVEPRRRGAEHGEQSLRWSSRLAERLGRGELVMLMGTQCELSCSKGKSVSLLRGMEVILQEDKSEAEMIRKLSDVGVKCVDTGIIRNLKLSYAESAQLVRRIRGLETEE